MEDANFRYFLRVMRHRNARYLVLIEYGPAAQVNVMFINIEGSRGISITNVVDEVIPLFIFSHMLALNYTERPTPTFKFFEAYEERMPAGVLRDMDPETTQIDLQPNGTPVWRFLNAENAGIVQRMAAKFHELRPSVEAEVSAYLTKPA